MKVCILHVAGAVMGPDDQNEHSSMPRNMKSTSRADYTSGCVGCRPVLTSVARVGLRDLLWGIKRAHEKAGRHGTLKLLLMNRKRLSKSTLGLFQHLSFQFTLERLHITQEVSRRQIVLIVPPTNSPYPFEVQRQKLR